MASTDVQVRLLVREGMGIRGITRILNISKGTVFARIKELAARIKKPMDAVHKASFEVDELWTYLD
jgi:insertion element IS1 protein InsB